MVSYLDQSITFFILQQGLLFQLIGLTLINQICTYSFSINSVSYQILYSGVSFLMCKPYLLVRVMTIWSVIWSPIRPSRFQFWSSIRSRWCSISTTGLDVTHVLNAGSYPWNGSPKHFCYIFFFLSWFCVFGLWH